MSRPAAVPPVLVYGALRSGTTVFRLMLNAHERIHNPGEVDFLFDFLGSDGAGGWRYDREALAASRIFRAHGLAMPKGLDGLDLMRDFIAQFQARAAAQAAGGVLTMNLHRHARRMAELLPEARVIHLLRDPRDVARSSVGMGWAALSYYGVDHWIETERDWDAARIAADRVLSLKFEDLMADLGARLDEVCAFLGVPFSPTMLEYHRHTTYGPPDPNMAEQWRRKATPREIALIEGKCGDLIAARGYARGAEPHLPGAAERADLALRNRLGRWRMGVRRFGLPLYLGMKLSGMVGLRRLHLHLRQLVDAKIAKSLK